MSVAGQMIGIRQSGDPGDLLGAHVQGRSFLPDAKAHPLTLNSRQADGLGGAMC